MSTVFLRFDEKEPEQALRCLRNQMALVRALIDELERVAPPAGADLGFRPGAAAQLADEVRRLGGGMLEYAAALAREDSSAEWVTPSRILRAGE